MRERESLSLLSVICNIYFIKCILVRLNIFLCKYYQFTVNASICSNHSIADDFRPIPPKTIFLKHKLFNPK